MKFIFVAVFLLAAHAYGKALPKGKGVKTDGKYLIKTISKAEQNKALEYWTPERVRQAVSAPGQISEISQEEATKQGIDVEAAKIFSNLASRPVRAVVPHTNNTQFPYSIMGKVLSTYSDPTDDGPGTTCSGQYVYNNTFAIVLSAGHCTFNCSAQWFFDNFVFYQQYENGKYQIRQVQNVGVEVALCTDSNDYDYAFDYTFIQADPITEKNTIPVIFNDIYDKFTSYGYPTNYGKGDVLQSYAGGKGIIQAGKVQMPNNPMDAGSDGGVWLGAKNEAVGVNSFRVKGVAGVWSPEFNNSTISLLQYVISQG